jgi:hypothetical protein
VIKTNAAVAAFHFLTNPKPEPNALLRTAIILRILLQNSVLNANHFPAKG